MRYLLKNFTIHFFCQRCFFQRKTIISVAFSFYNMVYTMYRVYTTNEKGISFFQELYKLCLRLIACIGYRNY
jgi:hypothetical protein